MNRVCVHLAIDVLQSILQPTRANDIRESLHVRCLCYGSLVLIHDRTYCEQICVWVRKCVKRLVLSLQKAHVPHCAPAVAAMKKHLNVSAVTAVKLRSPSLCVDPESVKVDLCESKVQGSLHACRKCRDAARGDRHAA